MARPFTHLQSLQNAAFLRALARTGNVHEAARTLGVHRSTYTKRRAKDPVFATQWDAALATAHAALHARPNAAGGQGAATAKTKAAPPLAVRTAGTRLQLRRRQRGRLTPEHRQTFLAALSATANIRLSAAATGLSHCAFYRLRDRDPGFAREMRLALAMGYERVEGALLASFDPAAHADDAWRHNDPPPIPPMSVDQAMQVLNLHQRAVTLREDRPDRRQRRGEPGDVHAARMAALYYARLRRDVEDDAIALAERNAADYARLMATLPEIVLPALDQVMPPARTPERAPVKTPPPHDGAADATEAPRGHPDDDVLYLD